MIVVADSSPLITLARAHRFDLLHEFYAEVIVSREVHDEVIVAGAGLPGAKEVQEADWIRVYPGPLESSAELKASCVGLGIGERSIIYLAAALSADLVLIDEQRARRAARGETRRTQHRWFDSGSGGRHQARPRYRSSVRVSGSSRSGNSLRPSIARSESCEAGPGDVEVVRARPVAGL